MKSIGRLLVVFFCFLYNNAVAQFTEPDYNPNMWVTDGEVKAILQKNNTLYMGGNFSIVGPNTGGGASLSTSNGRLQNTSLCIFGQVYASVPDGSGGWYIGGSFSKVGTIDRTSLAHILPDNTLDLSWNPSVNNPIRAMAISGNTLYIGGDFFSVGGQTRNRLAAFDLVTGNVTAWNPNVDNTVNTILISGSTVYFGGGFTTVGGLTRNNLAAVDASSGQVSSWDPDANKKVYTLCKIGSLIYVGGEFAVLGSQSRSRIGAVDAISGAVSNWNPSAGGVSVNSIAIRGSDVYVGGNFAGIGGQSSNYLAAVNINTGLATSWNPNSDGPVNSITISDSIVYAGGYFTNVGGQARKYIAALNPITGLATAWKSMTSNDVKSIVINGSSIYVGGSFNTIGAEERYCLASINTNSGVPTSWKPSCDGGVFAFAMSGSNLYVGGTFTSIGGQSRNRIAAVDTSTGIATSWNPNSGGTVNALAISGSNIYVGGLFTTIGGQVRNRIAALNLGTGLATTWNPNSSTIITTIAITNNIAYVGGGFTTIGGQTRNRIAAIDLNTGLATSWNPDANAAVNSVVISGNTIYVGGAFTAIGGQTRNRVAALDITTGMATSWDPNCSGTVYSLVVSNSSIYVGGLYSTIGGTSRGCLAAIDASTGTVTSWNPGIFSNGTPRINALILNGTSLYAGGDFTYHRGSRLRRGITSFSVATSCENVASITASGPTTFCTGGSVTLTAPAGFSYLWSNGATTQSITASTSGSYTVQTIANGCTSAASAATVVTVNTAPATPTITAGGPRTFCSGGSVTLTAPAGFSYLWSTNETTQSINVTTAGSYTVQTIASGCTSAASAATVVTVNSAPSTPSITAGGPTTFCTGGSVTLSAPAGFTYLWSNGATTQSIIASTAGSYTVQTIANGCTSAASAATVVTVNTAPATPSITAGGPTTFCTGGSVTLTAPAGFSYLWSTNETTQSINVTTAGSYTVQTIASGCTSAASAATVVTVNSSLATPSITAGGPTTFCTGGSVTLSAPAGFSYLWSTNETTQSINVTTAGSYTVQTIASGCTSAASAATVVTVNSSLATPSITAGGPTTFCTGGSVTLTAPAGFSYLWSTNETTQSINVTTAGSYTVQTIANGCTSAASAATVVTVSNTCLMTYTGTGNWNTLANWSPSRLPTADDSVIIAPSANLTVNSTGEAKSVYVSASANVVFVPGGDLSVVDVLNNNGTVSANGAATGGVRFTGAGLIKGNQVSINRIEIAGSLKLETSLTVLSTLDLGGRTLDANGQVVTLRSTANRTAELLQPTGSAILNGNRFKVERYMSPTVATAGPNGGAWVWVGAQTTGQRVNVWETNNPYASATYNLGTNNNSSVWYYNPLNNAPGLNGYTKPSAPTMFAPIGQGFRVWFRRSSFFDGSGNATWLTEGEPLIGTKNWSLLYCPTNCGGGGNSNGVNGWNLVANPYAATIDWDAASGWTRNNVSAGIYINRTNLGSSATYINGVGLNGGSRYIPSGQGFMVWSTAAGASISATPSVIASGQQAAVQRNQTPQDVLKLTVTNGTHSDETAIRWAGDASGNFDQRYEAYKATNANGLNFSFNQLGDQLAVLADAYPTAQTVYPLSLSVPQSGNYQIQFDGMATLTNNWSVFLKDNDLNTMVPVIDGQAYSFNQSAGTTNRFSLVIMPAGPTNLASNLKLVMNLVPNPAKDLVRVNFSQTTTGLMTVTNQIGQVVISEPVNGQSHELNVSKLASGIYHVAIGGVVTKLVVE